MRRATFALVFLWAVPARAHQSSMSWSQVDVAGDGSVSYILRLSTRDLYEALGLPSDRDAGDEEIRAGETRLFDYALGRIRVAADRGSCPAEAKGLSIIHQTDRFVELRFVARCPAPLATLTIDYGLFFDLDPRHVGLLQVTEAGRTITAELTRASPRFAWTLGSRATSLGIGDFVVHGVEHIFTGYDHIAFVVGLLLVVVVDRRKARSLRQAALATLRVVTAFTAAHSLTLILAALEVVSLPSRLVECAIAASIVYVAIENMVRPEPQRRALLAFVFGLVHGLGFAAMLRPLLPPTKVVAPLLAFNVGVELGQLAIVAPLLPLLHALAHRRPADYRRFVVVGGSAVIGALGAWWLVQRLG